MKENNSLLKSGAVTLIAALCLVAIGYVLYQKYSTVTVEYSGLSESSADFPIDEAKKEILVTNEILNSDKIEFIQRKITGGGVNPGWVISLLETQPNIFTGRVIVDDGVYQHSVTLKEEVANVFVGEMKSSDGRKDIFSMKKTDKECNDEEGNIFQYTLNGVYGATEFNGCGGDVLKEAK